MRVRRLPERRPGHTAPEHPAAPLHLRQRGSAAAGAGLSPRASCTVPHVPSAPFPAASLWACGRARELCWPRPMARQPPRPAPPPTQPPPRALRLQMGGLGFVHYNNTIAEQLAHVSRVKAHTPGFVVSPAVLGPKDTIAHWDDIKVGSSLRGRGRRVRRRAARAGERGPPPMDSIGSGVCSGGSSAARCPPLWLRHPFQQPGLRAAACAPSPTPCLCAPLRGWALGMDLTPLLGHPRHLRCWGAGNQGREQCVCHGHGRARRQAAGHRHRARRGLRERPDDAAARGEGAQQSRPSLGTPVVEAAGATA
jgi:hypothetical protein